MANQTLREWYNDPINKELRYEKTAFKLIPDQYELRGFYSYLDIEKDCHGHPELQKWLDWYVTAVDKKHPWNETGFSKILNWDIDHIVVITLKKPE